MRDDAFRSNPSVDWETRLAHRKVVTAAERVSLAAERPVGRFLKLQNLNPFYHTGPITVLLLVIVLLTGVYLTLFYRFGFDTSYQSVADIQASVVGRVIRALHRYASGAAMVTALLHGWRTFFQNRFKGARWPAWLTGVWLVVFVWVIGVTGYWMIWDERVGPLNDLLGTKLAVGLRAVGVEAGSGWVFLLVLFLVHLGLSIAVGLFTWWHVKRLSRRKWFPPKYWTWLLTGLLVVASIAIPVGMLPKLQASLLPGTLPIDAFYLTFLFAPAILVIGGTVISVLASFLPWTRGKQEPIVIDRDRCTGCTFCVDDCPYDALRMISREDGTHQQEAIVDPNLCVSCGVCIGSCPEMAMTLGDVPAEALWDTTMARIAAHTQPPVVVFMCERHALHGASRLDDGELLVALPCIGVAHPKLASDSLDAGAAEVRFVGCPPEDCANREGNEFLEQRIERTRRPRLRKPFADAPVGSAWLPPDQTPDALTATLHKERATGYTAHPDVRQLTRPGVFMVAVFAIQLLLTNVSFTPPPVSRVVVDFVHSSGHPIEGVSSTGLEIQPGTPLEVTLTVDGEVAFQETYGTSRSIVYDRQDIEPGSHHIVLTIDDRDSGPIVLSDETVTLDPRRITTLTFNDLAVGGDPDAGKELFEKAGVATGAGCVICHSTREGQVLVGPSLYDVGDRAATRIPGMSAEEYLRQSILDPNAYVVEGFPANQMLSDYRERLTPQQLDDLVAYLLTLRK